MGNLIYFRRVMLCLACLATIVLAHAQLGRSEYFFDTDPGAGNGYPLTLTLMPGGDSAAYTGSITVPAGMQPGSHQLYVRSYDAQTGWSIYERRSFMVLNSTTVFEKLEYFFDTDPGVGNANALTFDSTGILDADFTGNVSTTGLSAGYHNLYIRAKSLNGGWSIYESRGVRILPSGQAMVAAEYFYDTDPGVGNGTSIDFNVADSSQAEFTGNFNTAGLSIGNHQLYVRAKASNGSWSIYERRSIEVLPSGKSISAAEYFFDTDPGVGNGTALPVTQEGLTSELTASISTVGLAGGYHSLYIRAKGRSNDWGIYEKQSFFVKNAAVAAEYFVDKDPGAGKASPLPLSAINEGAEYAGNISLPGCLEIGKHVLYIRAKDAMGSWGLHDSTEFIMNTTQPSLMLTSVPVLLNTCPDNSVKVAFTSSGNFEAGNSFIAQLSDAAGSFVSPLNIGTIATSPEGCTIADTITAQLPETVVPGNGYRIRVISTTPADTSANNGTDITVNPMATFYRDADGDGFGNLAVTTMACTAPAGYVADNTDCDDNNNAVHTTFRYYVDADHDGYGGTDTVLLCAATPPMGYSTSNTDCNDNDATVYTPQSFFVDADHDGFGSTTTALVCASIPPLGYSSNSTDCNDNDAAVHETILYYVDNDRDGYGSTVTAMLCVAVAPAGYSSNHTDCDDNNADVHQSNSYYVDADHDGFGAGVSVALCAATAPYGYSVNNTDCNDNDAAVHEPIAYYVDADQDGYGSNTSVLLCVSAAPVGYAANHDDCDDNDVSEHPGQVWYIDNDGDGYGAGISVTQCLRPAHGYTNAELVAVTGDCNDNNAAINPAAQSLSFSSSPNFTNSIIYPLNGTSYTQFAFEVKYTDANNALPPATFPRVMMDYEGNSIYNDANDRTIVMTPVDVNDNNTADGKLYRATINQLATGTSWRTHIEVVNSGCITRTEAVAYPLVQVQPNLQIFANDISFSANNPAVSSPLTVTAVIHNESDFAAENFYAHLVNQYDTTIVYGDVLVAAVAPHSTKTISWNITTPVDPAWCPMQVSIDYTNAIAESNELDNSAIRPFINGNYNLPGEIVATAVASPAATYFAPNVSITVSGRAYYRGTAVPLQDSSVAGATVSFTVQETGITYSGYTNSAGYYSIAIPAPQQAGVYHVQGNITDFTLTGNFTTQFTMLTPPCLPDLTSSITLSSGSIIAGGSVSGNIKITNAGCAAAASSNLQVYQSGGTPSIGNIIVPALGPGESFTQAINLQFVTVGSYTLTAIADATYLVQEASEDNNTAYAGITVLPALPDLYAYDGPRGTHSLCNGGNTSLGFVLRNGGGVASTAVDCDIVVRRNGVLVTTLHKNVPAIAAQNLYSFSLPYTYTSAGNYSFELKIDVPHPDGVLTEVDETNNVSTFGVVVQECPPPVLLPNLYITNQSCQQTIGLQPVDPQYPGTITLTATVGNNGTVPVSGPVTVRFMLSGGSHYDVVYNNGIAVGEQVNVSTNIPTVAPATQTLRAKVDALDAIEEINEGDNLTAPENMCWQFSLGPVCLRPSFWQNRYVINQSTPLFIGVWTGGQYLASQVKVRFQVSGPGITGMLTLGDAVVNNPRTLCTNCPNEATLPSNFVFSEEGTYTFTMTVDPDNVYTECDESNNVMVVTVQVVNAPDMRILSQYIAPSKLNPDLNEPITMNVSYENIGAGNINEQMKLKVLVNDVPHSTVTVGGLVNGDKATVAIPVPWSSNLPGIHVIRAIIDADNTVAEVDEMNNEATRAIIVGEAANMKFLSFTSSNAYPGLNAAITMNAQVQNDGDVACESDVQFFYLNNNADSMLVGTVHVSLAPHASKLVQQPWFVQDVTTTLVAKIINSSTLEATYDDNIATTVIGDMLVTLASANSCNGWADGALAATVQGGMAPYNYLWSNSQTTNSITAVAGSYTVTVTDAEGHMATATGTIANTVATTYYKDEDGDGYGNAALTTLSCTGAPVGYVSNNVDCDDSDASVGPSTVFTMTEDIVVNGNLDLKNPDNPTQFPCWKGGKLILAGKSLIVNGTITGYDLTHFIVTNGNGCLRINNTNVTNTFPIGTSATSPNFARITNNGTPDSYCVSVREGVNKNGTSGELQEESAVNRTWDITEQTPGGSNAAVALFWSEVDELDGFSRSICAGAHYTGGKWVIGAYGSANVEAGGLFSKTQTGYTSFSPFSVVGLGTTILPVKLLSFTVEKKNGSALLYWRTDALQQVKSFVVERSTDGQQYEQISLVEPNATHQYSFAQQLTANGKYYFRLKLIDADGSSTYSEVRMVILSDVAVVEVYPNPAKLRFNIVTSYPAFAYKLMDAKGSVVKAGNSSASNTSIDATTLRSGLYILQITADGKTTNIKLVRE